jgi:hypothetical protein
VKVRIKATPPEREIEGIKLDHFDPGTVREVSPAIGAWLMAEGHAVLEMRNSAHHDQRNQSHPKKQLYGCKDRRHAVHDRRSRESR